MHDARKEIERRMMNILLTGATGYIGSQLKEKLLQDENVKLRLFVRNASKVKSSEDSRITVYEGSTFDKDSLQKALSGMNVAYYLIHSIGAKADFEKLDRISAENFREACIAAGVKRIIYLGGLGVKETASKRSSSGKRLSTKTTTSSRRAKSRRRSSGPRRPRDRARAATRCRLPQLAARELQT